MLRSAYTFLLYLFTPFILFRLYWKGRRLAAYRCRIAERFSLTLMQPTDVWLHAVSLGEVVAATPLIEALLAKRWRVLVTTMTPTGSQQVIARFGTRVAHQYIPYDLPWALRRFFRAIDARLGIIMETELWPNLIEFATREKVPMILMNARISDKAFPSYKRSRFFFKPVLSKFKAILAQSELDAARFIKLGALKRRVHAIGNMKFDLQIQSVNRIHIEQFEASWGIERPVFIAASTHDDEENQLLTQLEKLKSGIPNILVLIAPRHPERFRTVYDLCCQFGLNTALRSEPETINSATDVVVLDSLGELLSFYEASDYAFVGGSLVPVGGHNVLEPIAMQVPVFTGPFMMNSKAICSELLAASAMQSLENVDALYAAIIKLHQNPSQRIEQIEKAKAVLELNKGTVVRSMKVVVSLIKPIFQEL